MLYINSLYYAQHVFKRETARRRADDFFLLHSDNWRRPLCNAQVPSLKKN